MRKIYAKSTIKTNILKKIFIKGEQKIVNTISAK